MSNVKIVKQTRFLSCAFTEAELRGFAADMARAFAEKQRHVAQAKTAAAFAKGQIEAAEERIGKAARKLNTGHEERPVECEISLLYDTGRAVVLRCDTGDFVEDRAMTTEERQTELPFDAPLAGTLDEQPVEEAEAQQEETSDDHGEPGPEPVQVNGGWRIPGGRITFRTREEAVEAMTEITDEEREARDGENTE